jgi:hypothetical protein
MRSKLGRGFLAYLILCNFLRLPAFAQTPQGTLRITVVEGEGAVHGVRQKALKDPVVQVEDDARRPLTGAAVVFFLPDQGPSGEFFNGQKTITVTTNPQGRATATGLKLNSTTGPMQVRVTASFGGQTASTVINQYVGAGQRSSGGLSTGAKVLIFLAIAGGAAVGAIVATSGKKDSGGGGGSTPTTPPIVITPGTPTVGGPR